MDEFFVFECLCKIVEILVWFFRFSSYFVYRNSFYGVRNIVYRKKRVIYSLMLLWIVDKI